MSNSKEGLFIWLKPRGGLLEADVAKDMNTESQRVWLPRSYPHSVGWASFLLGWELDTGGKGSEAYSSWLHSLYFTMKKTIIVFGEIVSRAQIWNISQFASYDLWDQRSGRNLYFEIFIHLKTLFFFSKCIACVWASVGRSESKVCKTESPSNFLMGSRLKYRLPGLQVKY